MYWLCLILCVVHWNFYWFIVPIIIIGWCTPWRYGLSLNPGFKADTHPVLTVLSGPSYSPLTSLSPLATAAPLAWEDASWLNVSVLILPVVTTPDVIILFIAGSSQVIVGWSVDPVTVTVATLQTVATSPKQYQYQGEYYDISDQCSYCTWVCAKSHAWL